MPKSELKNTSAKETKNFPAQKSKDKLIQNVPPKEEKPTESIVPQDKKRKLPCFKLLLAAFILMLLLGVTCAATFFFISSRRCEKDKRDCLEELALTQIEQYEAENSGNEQEEEGEETDCPECVCNCPDCVCPGLEEESCSITFTGEEQLMMDGWVKYTNNTYHYSFMHPASWMIMDTYPDSLEAGESLHFEFFVLAGDTLNDEILPDYPFSVEDGFVKEVYCTKSYQLRVSQPPPDEWEGVATYMVYEGTPYLTWVRFLDEGASVTSDTVELYDLILKTFEFE